MVRLITGIDDKLRDLNDLNTKLMGEPASGPLAPAILKEAEEMATAFELLSKACKGRVREHQASLAAAAKKK